MALEKTLYTARATTTGGRRNGRSTSSDGNLAVTLNAPKELGGNGDGTNPEQLFASGYSACFLGAMQFVAGTQKITLSPETSITADVGFGPLAGGKKGFGVSVAMSITVPGMDRSAAQALVNAAHEVCPYSNATRGNVDVTLTVV
jgi:Ohr subfamily peroxiredoxin